MPHQSTPFPPENYLDLCRNLISLSNSFQEEALYRTLLNRCYYASYLSCARYELGLDPDEYNSHKDVYDSLRTPLKSALLRLWKKRLAADYYLTLPTTIKNKTLEEGDEFQAYSIEKRTARKAIKLAECIIREVT